jgi:hypothetical protein
VQHFVSCRAVSIQAGRQAGRTQALNCWPVVAFLGIFGGSAQPKQVKIMYEWATSWFPRSCPGGCKGTCTLLCQPSCCGQSGRQAGGTPIAGLWWRFTTTPTVPCQCCSDWSAECTQRITGWRTVYANKSCFCCCCCLPFFNPISLLCSVPCVLRWHATPCQWLFGSVCLVIQVHYQPHAAAAADAAFCLTFSLLAVCPVTFTQACLLVNLTLSRATLALPSSPWST